MRKGDGGGEEKERKKSGKQSREQVCDCNSQLLITFLKMSV